MLKVNGPQIAGEETDLRQCMIKQMCNFRMPQRCWSVDCMQTFVDNARVHGGSGSMPGASARPSARLSVSMRRWRIALSLHSVPAHPRAAQ
jgi:hypothetical protein